MEFSNYFQIDDSYIQDAIREAQRAANVDLKVQLSSHPLRLLSLYVGIMNPLPLTVVYTLP